jgi:hypothetical protein
VLSVCVEVSSAAMYLDNDPGVLISACLFGDGAGAAVLARPSAAGAGAGGRRIEWKDSTSLIEPRQRERADVRAARRHAAQHPDPRRARLAAEHAQRVLARCSTGPA